MPDAISNPRTSSRMRMLAALALALTLAWVSMHLFLACLGFGITSAELLGRASPEELADVRHAANMALSAAVATQLAIGQTLSFLLVCTCRPMHKLARHIIGFAAGLCCSAILVACALSTGGAMVVPGFEQFLKVALMRI